MRYFSGNRIKLRFGKPTFEIVNKTDVRCVLPYKVNVPGMYSETLGLHVHVAVASNPLFAIGVAKLAPNDTFDGEIGRKTAESRAEAAAYKHALKLISGVFSMAEEYANFVDDFDAKADDIIEHNIEHAKLVESIVKSGQSQKRVKKTSVSEPTLFDDDTVTETTDRKRKSNGRDVTPVVCVKKEGERYHATAVAVTRKEMEKITGVDSRLISNSSKYLRPIAKNSNTAFYRVTELLELFKNTASLQNVLHRTRKMMQQNGGRVIGDVNVPYIRFRECYLEPMVDGLFNY